MNLLSETTQNIELSAITTLLNQSDCKSDYTDCGNNTFEEVFDTIKNFNNIASEIETKIKTTNTPSDNADNSNNTTITEDEISAEDISNVVYYEEETNIEENIKTTDNLQIIETDSDISDSNTETKNFDTDNAVNKEQIVIPFTNETVQTLSDVFVNQYVLSETNLSENTEENDINNNANAETKPDTEATEATKITYTENSIESITQEQKDNICNKEILEPTVQQYETKTNSNIEEIAASKEIKADEKEIEHLSNEVKEIKSKATITNKESTEKIDINHDIVNYTKSDNTKNINNNLLKTDNTDKNDIQNTKISDNKILNEISQMAEKLNAEISAASDITDETTPEILPDDDLSEMFIKTQINENEENNNTKIKDKTEHSNNTEALKNNIENNKKTNKEYDTNKENSEELPEEPAIKFNKTVAADNENIQNNEVSALEHPTKISSVAKIQIKTDLTTGTKNNVLNDITAKFEQFKDGTTKKINIILRPENLGKVGVELVSRADGISARILTDTQQIKELLDKNINILKTSLQTQGVNVNNITIKAVENSQSFEFNTAHNFDFSNEQNQQRNNILKNKSDNDYENHRKYEAEENDNPEENIPELKKAERLYTRHTGKVDLVI